MGTKQDDNPNLNRGGNEGNKFGAGRPSNEIRKKYLEIAGDGAEYLRKIARGNKAIEEDIVVQGQTKKIVRRPTHTERVDAIEIGVKAGLPQKVEITLDSDAVICAVVDAMMAEKHSKEAIKLVIDRLRETLKDIA